MKKLTQERVKNLMHYNPATGVFIWTHRKSGVTPGMQAGSKHVTGYIDITVDGRVYKAHRLAILWMEGYWPEHTVDHINRIRDDNRYLNLREATYQCQARNCKVAKNNTSVVTWVRWRSQRGSWQAFVMVSGKIFYLGHYKSVLAAAYARYAAEQCLGFQDCDINSSAKQYIEAHR